MPLTDEQRKQVDLEKAFTLLSSLACEACLVPMNEERLARLVHGPEYCQSYEDLAEEVRRGDSEFFELVEGLQKLGMECLDGMVILLAGFCQGRIAVECARRTQLPPSEHVRPHPRPHH